MAGTRQGGLKARDTCKRVYGDDYYRTIGAMGGSISRTGGFAQEGRGKDGMTGQERARKYGVIGGKLSKREPKR